MMSNRTKAQAFTLLLGFYWGCDEATTTVVEAPNTCSPDAGLDPTGIRLAPRSAASRPVATAFERTRPCPVLDPTRNCSSHLDCEDGINGRCMPTGAGCTYDECIVDEDCPQSEVCDCAGGLNGNHACRRAECRVDADCPEGMGCSPSSSAFCPRTRAVLGYFCHRVNDTCREDAECDEGEWCAFHPREDLWRCTAGDPMICVR